jgi:hypothetical protein
MTLFSTRLRLVVAGAALAATVACGAGARAPQTFAVPEDAVAALLKAAQQDTVDGLLTLFGPDAKALVQSSSPAEARRNRDVFVAAMAEGWRLEGDPAGRKVLVVGNEEWPFPIPLVPDARGWKYDIAAGADEVLGRRIGRNELTVIGLCRRYVAAQRLYAASGHDGRPAGRYAKSLRSDPGTQNGLYWPVPRGEKASPLGELVAEAAQQHEPLDPSRPGPLPFHGYHFAVLTEQGARAPGGLRDYVQQGEMTGGFALVAWPAQFGVTGIMTFVVAEDGTVYQKSLGDQTFAVARALKRYDPDSSWTMAN